MLARALVSSPPRGHDAHESEAKDADRIRPSGLGHYVAQFNAFCRGVGKIFYRNASHDSIHGSW